MRSATLATTVPLAAALAAALVLGAPACGDMIEFTSDTANSTEGLGDFAGNLEYGVNGALGTLVISLTNTTPHGIGGFITGFLFNIEGDDAKAMLVESTYEKFLPANGGGAPFGQFETGATLGGKFLGGGKPSYGIGIGDTGVFTLAVEGGDVPSLTAASFLGNFVVRFRGMAGDQSDKVPAVITSVPIPLPAPLSLGAAGLAAVWMARRRRRGT